MAINKLDDQNKMNFKKIINYSPNFDLKKRKKKSNKIFSISLHWNEKGARCYKKINK